MDVKEALAWAERKTNTNPIYATLAAAVRELEAENAVRNDEVTGLMGMNADLKAELAAEKEYTKFLSAACDTKETKIAAAREEIARLTSLNAGNQKFANLRTEQLEKAEDENAALLEVYKGDKGAEGWSHQAAE